jgi:hypothetical protein
VAVLSISSVTSSNHLYLPALPVQAETNARPDSENRQDPVQLSDRAKQLLAAPIQPEESEAKDIIQYWQAFSSDRITKRGSRGVISIN